MMEEWEYRELIEAVQETYKEFLKRENGDTRKVTARLSDYFYNMGKTEDLIILTVIGEIVLTHEDVFIGLEKRVRSELGAFRAEEYAHELTREELQDLSDRIRNVLQGIEHVKIREN
jgi:hypothetical protein